MYSKLAQEDLDDLRAEGLTPTDADIVRLHALASRITDGQETTAYNIPRFAVAGGVVFWEPTMAAQYWYAYAKTFAEDEDTEDWLFAFACAKGRERGLLENLRDPAEIRRALGAFVGAFAGTRDEMERAVLYASAGVESEKPEKTELAKEREKQTPGERERRYYAAMEEMLANAAAATGLTYEDIMLQTPSRLCGMIYAAHVKAGLAMTRPSAAAHADYLATLRAVANRLRAERDARQASSHESSSTSSHEIAANVSAPSTHGQSGGVPPSGPALSNSSQNPAIAIPLCQTKGGVSSE